MVRADQWSEQTRAGGCRETWGLQRVLGSENRRRPGCERACKAGPPWSAGGETLHVERVHHVSGKIGCKVTRARMRPGKFTESFVQAPPAPFTVEQRQHAAVQELILSQASGWAPRLAEVCARRSALQLVKEGHGGESCPLQRAQYLHRCFLAGERCVLPTLFI